MRAARQVLAKPPKPFPRSELPDLAFPPGTSIIFSEATTIAGNQEVTYRGLVECTADDVPALELATPHWLLSLLLQGEAQDKEPVKMSFSLQPWTPSADAMFGAGPQPMPELPSG